MSDEPHEGRGASPYLEAVRLTDDATGAEIHSVWDPEIPMLRLGLGGTFLSYVDVGSGEPIVMIPGFMGTVANFAPLIEVLSSSYRVIAFDPIGYGYSDRPSIKYSPDEYFRFARRFIEKLGVWPATIIGHSMGGSVAFALAVANPELIRGLVMVAPRPPIPVKRSRIERLLRYGANRSPKATERLATHILKTSAGAIARADTPKGAFDDHKAVRRRLGQIHRAPGSARVGARSGIRMDEWAEWNGRLGEIEAESLLIWGSRDRVVRPANIREFTGQMPQLNVEVINGAGHVPMLDSGDRVAALVLNFCNQIYL